jgi:predicted PurR-regulated permease PerM
MKRTGRTIIWTAFIGLALLLLLWGLFLHKNSLFSLFRMLLTGTVSAYIATPLCDILEKRISRTAAIAVIILILGGLLASFIFLFIPQMAKEIAVMAERFPVFMRFVRGILGDIQRYMDKIGIPQGVQDSVLTYADTFQKTAADFVMDSLMRIVSGAIRLPSVFVGLVLGFYFLKDREYFGRVLIRLIPLRSHRRILQIAGEINHILHCFIRGEVLIASVVGIISTIAYLIIGLPYALILGFLMGILELIPYFGPWMGAIPAILAAYLTGSSKVLWSTIIALILTQQLESVFITPKILGGELDLHPVYVILSLWAGSLFFGIIGMFLAVPVVLILRVIIKHAYLSLVGIN